MTEQEVWLTLVNMWLALGGLAVCIGALIRNNQVYDLRTKILRDEYIERVKRIESGDMKTIEDWKFDRLPGYTVMMLKFWKPVESFVQKKET